MQSKFGLLKKAGAALLGLVIFVFLLLWISSFYLIPWQANEQLKPYQLVLGEDTSVGVNPFLLQVEIEDLSIVSATNGKVQGQIKHALLDVSWFALLSKQIQVEVLDISSLEVAIKRDAQGLQVAGFAIPLNSEESAEAEPQEREEQTKQPEQAPLDWQFVMAQANFDRLVFNLNDQGHKQQLTFEKIQLADIEASLAKQHLELDIRALINKAPLTVSVKADVAEQSQGAAKVSVAAELKLQDLALADFAYLVTEQEPKALNDLSGFVDFTAAYSVSSQGAQWLIKQPELSVVVKELQIGLADMLVKSQNLELKGKDIELQIDAQGKPNANASIDLLLEGVDAGVVGNEGKQKGTLASFTRLAIPSIAVSFDGSGLPGMQIEKIELQDLVTSQPVSEMMTEINPEQDESESLAEQAVFATELIAVEQVSLQQQHLAINQIALSAFSSQVLLNKDKQLANLVLPTSSEEAETTPTETDTTAEQDSEAEQSQANFTFSLDKFVLLEQGKVHFKDESVTPIFEQELVFDTLELTALDSKQPEQAMQYAIGFKLDQYAGADIKGSLTPFAEQLTLQTTADIRELSLPSLSSYMRDALGFDFLAGQLDTELEVKVIKDEIDGEVNIGLRGFELSSDSDEVDDHLKESTAIPLNAALNMLKDSDNNLNLDVPLSGNVKDPQFGISSFLTLIAKKAVMAQAESYLINTFVPYANVVTVAKVAGEYLLRLEVEDLLYQPQQVEPDNQQDAFINELAALLTDKPEEQVRVCAYAVSSDDEAAASKGKEEQIKLLKAVSKARGEALKLNLVEQHQIASSRLLLCEAKVDLAKGAKPRVAFSF